MYIRIVRFGLAGIARAEYEALAAQVAGGFRQWPGLLAKYWLADADAGIYGGVYLFDSRDSAEKSRSTALFAGLVDNPAFTDLTVDEYDTLNEPTRLTAPLPIAG